MDLLVTLTRTKGNYIPLNYQYAVSSWIYRTIRSADSQYSSFLHEQGFSFDSRSFKMFTFSQLDLRPYKIEGNAIQLLGNEISLNVRFMADKSIDNFIKGLFLHQRFSLGSREAQCDFEVTKVEALPTQRFTTTMRYECLSPIVVSAMRDDRTTAYLSPDDNAYGLILIQNLVRKHAALAMHVGSEILEHTASSYSFRLLNEPRKKGTTIKEGTAEQTKVIAYLFRFELTAPAELHEVGYYAGMGEKNAMGFGCVGLK